MYVFAIALIADREEKKYCRKSKPQYDKLQYTQIDPCIFENLKFTVLKSNNKLFYHWIYIEICF